MRLGQYVLMSLATLGCIGAQEPSGRQKTEPGKLDFTFRPQAPSIQQTEPGKLDFTFPPRLRRPIPKNPPTAIAPYSALSTESSTLPMSGVSLSPSVCSSLTPEQRSRNGLCV